MSKERYKKNNVNFKIHAHTKHSVYHGFCVCCLEKSKFRHCLVDGQNSIVCVICRNAKGLRPGTVFPSHMILKKIDFTHMIHRFFIRLKNPKRTYKILKYRNFLIKNIRRILCQFQGE